MYLDTSALAKLYLPEPESDTLDRALQGRADLIVSDLALTELVAAAARRAREGTMPHEAARRIALEAVRHAEPDGLFRKVDITAATHRDAERLLLMVRDVALRAADALHLAIALAAAAATVATYDERMAATASRAGLLAWAPR